MPQRDAARLTSDRELADLLATPCENLPIPTAARCAAVLREEQRKPAAAPEPEESSDEELDDEAAADAAADAASAAEAKAEAADVRHEAVVFKEIHATKSLARC